jgi:hypothetical protein
MITPEELIWLNDAMRYSGGLERRFLYCYSAPSKRINPFRPGTVRDEIASLGGATSAVTGFAWQYVMSSTDPVTARLAELCGTQPVTEMPFSDEVADSYDDISDRLPDIGRSYRRFTTAGITHVTRLALIYAIADHSTEIGMRHINAAMGLWEFCANSARNIFAYPVSTIPPKADPKKSAKVLTYLHETYPAWASRLVIYQEAIGKNCDRGEMEAIFADLLEQDKIESGQIRTGNRGRPVTRYRIKI